MRRSASALARRSIDHVVTLHNVPWAQYTALVDATGDSPGPRLTYLEGELQIMSPGTDHESWKTLLARLVETWADVHELSLNGFGSETFRDESEEAGFEPDECYFLGTGKRKAAPDLAIEVIVSRGSVDKLEIYRRFAVAEVWFWVEGKLQIHGLGRGGYKALRASRVLPGFPIREVERIVAATEPLRQAEAVRAFRRSLG